MTTKQPVVVCKEIAALSARLVSEAAASEDPLEDSGFDRQFYAQSQPSQPKFHHSLSDQSFSKSYVDINSNNVSSILSKNSVGKEPRRVRWCLSEDLSNSKHHSQDADQLEFDTEYPVSCMF